MLAPAVFGINSSGLDTAVKLLILVLVVVWLALVYYTYADARRRIGDPMLVACATAASLFPFVGTVVYMIVRPPEYLEDVRERALEWRGRDRARARGDGVLRGAPAIDPKETSPMDRTLILVKPDAFARGLTGEIIARFERKGLRLVALKHMVLAE